MLSKTKQIVIILAVSATLIPIFIFAGSTGKIEGVVTDKATGQPVPGASVMLVGTTLGTMTDSDGKFIITS